MGAGYMGVTSTLTSASVAALSLGSSLTLCTFDLRLVSMCELEAPVPFIFCLPLAFERVVPVFFALPGAHPSSSLPHFVSKTSEGHFTCLSLS